MELGSVKKPPSTQAKKKKKNCQRLLRVVVALNQGHTWEGCPQVPTHDVLICLSPFLRPEKNEKKNNKK